MNICLPSEKNRVLTWSIRWLKTNVAHRLNNLLTEVGRYTGYRPSYVLVKFMLYQVSVKKNTSVRIKKTTNKSSFLHQRTQHPTGDRKPMINFIPDWHTNLYEGGFFTR